MYFYLQNGLIFDLPQKEILNVFNFPYLISTGFQMCITWEIGSERLVWIEKGVCRFHIFLSLAYGR